jgi:2,3-bisphosphoglycerate-dependent phosphoglycerate mutase
MQLYFIRHAQSTNNALYDRTGSWAGRNEDPILTPIGMDQAERLAQFLSTGTPDPDSNGSDPQNRSGFGITYIYTSLMLRATITASVIARRLGLPIHGCEDLHENGGVYLEDIQTHELVGQPGGTQAFFKTNFPELVIPGTGFENGWWNRPFEQPAASWLRANRVVNSLREKHGKGDDRVALISHAGFYNSFLWAMLGVQEDPHYWFVLNNTAMTRVDFTSDGIHLVYLNRADHLSADLVT